MPGYWSSQRKGWPVNHITAKSQHPLDNPKKHLVSLLPEFIRVESTLISDVKDCALYQSEYDAVKHAVPKRIAEFTSGRILSRRILFSYGISDFPILIGNNRQPIWPDSIVASITHDAGFCAVAGTTTQKLLSLGVDIAMKKTMSSSVRNLICFSGELEAQPAQGTDAANIIFSCKESYFKCVFPLIGQYFDFLDVWIDIDASRGTFASHPISSKLQAIRHLNIQGRFRLCQNLVVSCAWIASNLDCRQKL